MTLRELNILLFAAALGLLFIALLVEAWHGGKRK